MNNEEKIDATLFRALIRPAALLVSLCLTSGVTQAVTITWSDNLSPGDPFPAALPVNNAAFSASSEFRIFGDGAATGGEQSLVNGAATTSLSWEFDDITGELLTVSGSDVTPGGTDMPAIPGLGVPGVGLFLNGALLGQSFGFLAPTLGSAAGNFYGVATISRTDLEIDGAFTIHFPVLELQWANTVSVPGAALGGVDFICLTTSGSQHCTAEYLGQAAEATTGLIPGKYLQWELAGTSAVPLPPAILLFCSGLIALFGNTYRKSRSG